MAQTYLTPIATVRLASSPGSPVAGWQYYDNALQALRYYNGTSWITLTSTTPGTSVVPYTQTVGDGSTTLFTITHNLGSLVVLPYVKDLSSGQIVYPTISITGVNTIQVSFTVAPTTNQYQVVVTLPSVSPTNQDLLCMQVMGVRVG